MVHTVGVRKEDRYAWERRVPLVPADAAELQRKHGIRVIVQSSEKRAFPDADYRRVGIEVQDSLDEAPVIFGIKEIPLERLEPGKTYVFFSHTIKGQAYNMPMLQRILDLGCTLIDYERIVDENNRRLIFFGNYAGLAGMIETLWAFGRRLAYEGIDNPFDSLDRPLAYPDLDTAKAAIASVGERIARDGLPFPLVIGFAGYGNVSRGAQEILSLLPVEEVSPEELIGFSPSSNRVVYKVVFKEKDMVAPVDSGAEFDLKEYYTHPERYRGVFARYLPHLDILVNCIYWEPRYPRLVTKEWVRENYPGARLRVIGDISCDVEGAIEATVKATEPDNPVYVYDPVQDRAIDGVEEDGPVIMAVDILPSELPREASIHFSSVLKRFVPAIAAADYGVEFSHLALPPELKRAVIVHRGALTPDYRYLEKFLRKE